jgi:outer membrane protein assembly factor BamB
MTTPMSPLIVNGVVFAVSRGKPAPAGDAARRPAPAVVYAMNGVDGKEFWSSGTTITSYMPGRSFWCANGQVYVGTADGAVYAFGFAMERK